MANCDGLVVPFPSLLQLILVLGWLVAMCLVPGLLAAGVAVVATIAMFVSIIVLFLVN